MRGHLRQRGDAWELRVFAGRDPVSGRRIYRTRTFRGGRRAAEDALTRFIQEITGAECTTRDVTVGDLITAWLELAGGDLSPSTVCGYQVCIRCYIEPTLSEVPLDRLGVTQIDRLYAQFRTGGCQLGQPLSTATIRQVHAILRRTLQQAVKWGWIQTNPAALASPPRVRHRPITAPAPAVVTRLIEMAGDDNSDMAVFLQLAATTGARRGEICGLRWETMDLEGGTVTIARSVVSNSRGAFVEKDTKTHSIRRIALDPTSVAALCDHRGRVEKRATACGTSIGPDAYVFSRAPDASIPWSPNDVTAEFAVFRTRRGVQEVRLHDFRHFAATRLLAAGIPVRTVSGRLGHANAATRQRGNAATTLGVYAHFLAESDREAAPNTIDAILTSSKSGSG